VQVLAVHFTNLILVCLVSLISGSWTVNAYGNGTKCNFLLEERIYYTFDGTLEPPFSVSQFMVLPHVTITILKAKIVIRKLNFELR
jgi:hypothetical protein